MMTEPLWRTTSRVLVTPPGSVMTSVETQKALLRKPTFEERMAARVRVGFGVTVEGVDFFAMRLSYHSASAGCGVASK